MADLTPGLLGAWVAAYERAWRDGPDADLGELFTADVEYLVEPYAAPLVGLPAIQELWAEEVEPDEQFTMSHAVVACSGGTGVVRVEVRYGDPVAADYRDLWVVAFSADGRASRFEEWPFWPSHGRSPAHPPPLVRHASDVPADPWAEVDGTRTAVRPGSVAYVPRRVPHRFVDVTEDLEVAVVFAPPESGS